MRKEDIIMNKEFSQFLIAREREKSDSKRWYDFEHELQYLLSGYETDIQNWLLVDNIKQVIIAFVTKDRFVEDNEAFFGKLKYQFYKAMEELEQRNPGIREKALRIKLFMEDYFLDGR